MTRHLSSSLIPNNSESWRALLGCSASSPLVIFINGKPVHISEGDDSGLVLLETERGFSLTVREHAALLHPIHLAYDVSDAESPPTQVEIILEKGSIASIVEHVIDDAPVPLMLTRAFHLDEQAELSHVFLHAATQTAHVVDTKTVTQAAYSSYVSHLFSLSGATRTHTTTVTLTAPHSSTVLNGLLLGADTDRVQADIHVDHLTGETKSDMAYKSILAGRAKSVFKGHVHIHKNAKKSEVSQSNRSLLLSPHAEAFSEPHLEIDTDDVKASHGATVGELDPAMLFYLRSRGIQKQDAEHLLTTAFATDLLDRLDHLDRIDQPLLKLSIKRMLDFSLTRCFTRSQSEDMR